MAEITGDLIRSLLKMDDEINALDYKSVTKWNDVLDDRGNGGDFESISNASGLYIRGVGQRILAKAKSKKSEGMGNKLRQIIREEIQKLNEGSGIGDLSGDINMLMNEFDNMYEQIEEDGTPAELKTFTKAYELMSKTQDAFSKYAKRYN